MIQYNTKNKSFLKMYHILNEMGIENNTFFLQLYDETLLNIDPLDEDNLTDEQKLRVHIEISKNPWYYFREIVKIPMTDTKLDFELHRGTLAILWTLLNDLKAYIILPRQCYKSYTVCVFYSWLIYWGAKNFSAAFFAQNNFLVTQNLTRVKDVRETLPKYLNLKSNEDTDNSRSLFYRNKEFTNSIVVRAPGMNEDAANNVGRGQSTMGQWWDEFPFIPYVWVQYGAAIPAFSTVSAAAERNGSHHHIIITTTAGNKNTKSGAWAYQFLNECAPFTELLYDKVIRDSDGNIIGANKNEIKDYIANNNGGKFFLRIEYMWYDLSKPTDYLDKMKAECGGMDEFNRGVLNMWTDSNADHPLGQERVQALVETSIDPVKVLMVDKIYVLKYYRDPELLKRQSNRIVFGMDCGGNTRRDYSTLVGVDITNSEVVCTMRVNQYSNIRFAKAVAYILMYLFPRSTLVGERNYIGIVILEMIGKIIGFNRLYKDNDNNPGVKLYDKLRNIMYGDVLRVSVVERGALIHDKTIINEIAGLQTTKSGRIDHNPKNGHDDTLIAYLYCRWFIMYCNTKRIYYDEILFNCAIDNNMSDDMIEELRYDNSEANVYGAVMNSSTDYITNVKNLKSNAKNNEYVKTKLMQAIDNNLGLSNEFVKGNAESFIDVYDSEPKIGENEISVDVAKDNNKIHEYTENLDKDDPEKVEQETEEIRDKSNDPVNMFTFNFKHDFKPIFN